MIYVHKETGERVEVDATLIRFFPQGGGRGLTMSKEAFDREFEPEATEPTIRKGTVTADFWDGTPLVCYADEDTWNGWGMPMFARYEAERLVGDPAQNLYWSGRNVCQDNDGEIDTWKPQTITVAGWQVEVWPIGAGSWSWDTVKFKE